MHQGALQCPKATMLISLSSLAGQSHLVKDERRQVSEDAACSTAKIGEESPLRPAGVRGSSSAGVKALTDSSGAVMESSSDPECDASSGEAIEEVIGKQVATLVRRQSSSVQRNVQRTADGELLKMWQRYKVSKLLMELDKECPDCLP